MDYPFTFKYGGLLSNSLLPKWKRTGGASEDKTWSRWESPDGLVVTMKSTYYAADATERTISFTHTGTEPAKVLTDVWALSRQFPKANGWRDTAKLHRLNGSLSQEDDWQPFTTELTPGSYAKWAPIDGRSSSGACPFFNLELAPGLGVIVAIGWTGQWRAEVWWGTKCELRVGMERLNISLEPGETISGPRVLTMDWRGDIEDSYNQFRKHMFDHVLPRVDGKVVVPPIAHLTTAAYEWNRSTQNDVADHVDAIKGLGFEVAWLDAYYLKPPGFPGAVGNYGSILDHLVDRDRFPAGLGRLGDYVHDAGMDWLVWHCFEAVAPGTWMDENHPEWLLRVPGEETSLYNLGHPKALEYMKGALSRVVTLQKLDWLRIDCCPGTKKYFEIADECVHRIGMTEIRWVEGLYSLLDWLLESFPHLKIDNCDGGGRRIDLEMCKRSTPLWRTDYTTPVQELGDWDKAAEVQQNQIAGLTRYVPYSSCGQFYLGPYYFRSAFNGGIGVLDDCRDEFYDRKMAREAIEEGKRIRPYFAGNYYIPIPGSESEWFAYQYHLPGEDRGMAMIFKRPGAQGSSIFICLNEIDTNARYTVRWYDNEYKLTRARELDGTCLREFTPGQIEPPAAILMEYEMVREK